MMRELRAVENLPPLSLTAILFGTIIYWHTHSYFKARHFTEERFISFIISMSAPYASFLLLIIVLTWVSNILVANTILAIIIVLYIVRDAHYSGISPWPVAFAPIITIVLSWWTELLQIGRSAAPLLSDLSASAPAAFLAAIFAYFGWQEAAINERDAVEEALNNRYRGRSFPDFSGHQIINQSAKVKIETIEVWETPSPIKRAIKYLPIRQFEGTTTLRIEFLTSEESVILSDLWRSLGSFQKVLSILQYEENKFSIMISTSSIRGVDRFIQEELMNSIPGFSDQYITMFDPDTGQASQMVRRSSSEDTPLFFNNSELDYGRRIAGNVEYNPIQRIGYFLLVSKEIEEIRRIVKSDNVYTWIYPDHPEIEAAPVVIRGKADDKKYPKRLFQQIRESSVPKQYKQLHPESRPERFRTAVQGLEIVRRRFVDTDIVQVSRRDYTSGEKYVSLDVSIVPSSDDTVGKQINFDGVSHYIPVENFRPSEFGCRAELSKNEFEKYEELIDEIMSSELTAEYVFTNQYDIGGIYKFGDVFLVFLWIHNGDVILGQIASELTSVLYPSIIWEKS